MATFPLHLCSFQACMRPYFPWVVHSACLLLPHGFLLDLLFDLVYYSSITTVRTSNPTIQNVLTTLPPDVCTGTREQGLSNSTHYSLNNMQWDALSKKKGG
jgi:hypothetical protein